jgi:hypothetical protein
MSIYGKEDLINVVREKTHEELVSIVNKLIKRTETKLAYDNLVCSIMNVSLRGKPQILISDKKSIDAERIIAISKSEIMDYIPALIDAALAIEGPQQTREIMLRAALRFEKPYYLKNTMLTHKDKIFVGHILIMAGFERISHYCKESKTPVKAWRLRYGEVDTDKELRAQIVYSKINEVVKSYMNESEFKVDDLI